MIDRKTEREVGYRKEERQKERRKSDHIIYFRNRHLCERKELLLIRISIYSDYY